jgi:hypothetical protein
MPFSMKRKLIWFILCLWFVGPHLPVHAASAAHFSEMNDVRVVIDGKTVTFAQPPIQIEGRMMLPLRGIFEHLGAKVTWSPDTQTVVATKGVQEVVLWVNRNIATVNYRPVIMEIPATIIHNSVMVPLRFVSEAFGAKVNWDQHTRTVYISSGEIGDRCSPDWYDKSLTEVPIGKIVVEKTSQPVYHNGYLDLDPVPDMVLAPGTERKVYEKIRIDGNNFYRIGTNLFVKASDSVKFIPIPYDQRTCIEDAVLIHHMERIVNGAAKQKSDVTKLMYVYTELMDLVQYDFDTRNGLSNNDLSYTWRGALAYGLAVCEGYSEALKLLLDKIGIESIIVRSLPMDHVWNMVKIDGKWYHVDATWEDTNKSTLYYSLKYFLLSDEGIIKQQHHSWESNVKATSNQFAGYGSNRSTYHFDFENGRLYYRSNGLWSDSLDLRDPVRLTPEKYSIRDVQYAEDAIYFSTLNEGLFRVTYDGKLELLHEGRIWKFLVYDNKLYFMVNEGFTDRNTAVYVSDLDGSNVKLVNRFVDYRTLTGFYKNSDIDGVIFYYSDGIQYHIKS